VGALRGEDFDARLAPLTPAQLALAPPVSGISFLRTASLDALPPRNAQGPAPIFFLAWRWNFITQGRLPIPGSPVTEMYWLCPRQAVRGSRQSGQRGASSPR